MDEPGALSDDEIARIRRFVTRAVRRDLEALAAMHDTGVEYLALLLGEVDRLRERLRESEGNHTPDTGWTP